MRHEKRILEELRQRGGRIDSSKPYLLINKIAGHLGIDGDGKNQEIEDALAALADKGAIRISRFADSSSIRSITLVKTRTAKKTAQSTPTMPAPPKVQATLAEKPVPSASFEVTISPPEPVKEEVNSEVTEMTKAERLTLALAAIQERANRETGIVDVKSTAKIIEELLEVGVNTALALNNDLYNLGLRWTINKGGGRYEHHVRLDVKEVTNKMIAEARERKKQSSPKSPTPVAPEATPVEEKPKPATAVEPSDNIADKLLGIIETLEGKLVGATESLERGSRVVERLRIENSQLGEQVASLQHQLAELQPTTVDPKLQQVLERYGVPL